MLQRGPWRRPDCGNSPRPDDCKIPWAGHATWSCRRICGILVWQSHHVNGILCHVKWPWSIVNAIQAWPTTETYDMAGKHWLNTISLLSGGAVRRNSLRCAPFGPPTVSCVLAPARTCLRQAPPTSRGRGLATSAVLHHLADYMQVNAFTLEKRCKKTSFFTPFQKIEQNGVKSGRFLHRLLDTRLRKAHLISDPLDQTQRSVAMPETEKSRTETRTALILITE